MNIETILISRIGDVGKRLHTGRSRNDQVALDLRMYLRSETDEIIKMVDDLKTALLEIAEKRYPNDYAGIYTPSKGTADNSRSSSYGIL